MFCSYGANFCASYITCLLNKYLSLAHINVLEGLICTDCPLKSIYFCSFYTRCKILVSEFHEMFVNMLQWRSYLLWFMHGIFSHYDILVSALFMFPCTCIFWFLVLCWDGISFLYVALAMNEIWYVTSVLVRLCCFSLVATSSGTVLFSVKLLTIHRIGGIYMIQLCVQDGGPLCLLLGN